MKVGADGADEGYLFIDGVLRGCHYAEAGSDAEAADANSGGVYVFLVIHKLVSGYQVMDVLWGQFSVGHVWSPIDQGGHIGTGEGLAEARNAGVVATVGEYSEEKHCCTKGAFSGGAVDIAEADGELYAFYQRLRGEPFQGFNGEIEHLGNGHGGLNGSSTLMGGSQEDDEGDEQEQGGLGCAFEQPEDSTFFAQFFRRCRMRCMGGLVIHVPAFR